MPRNFAVFGAFYTQDRPRCWSAMLVSQALRSTSSCRGRPLPYLSPPGNVGSVTLANKQPRLGKAVVETVHVSDHSAPPAPGTKPANGTVEQGGIDMRSINASVLFMFALLAGSADAVAQIQGRPLPPRNGVCFYDDINYGGDYFCTSPARSRHTFGRATEQVT